MTLIPWRKKQSIPVSRESTMTEPISGFRTEMDRLFDRFFHGSWMAPMGRTDEPAWPAHEFMPNIDVVENDEQITIRAEIPGMDPNDVDINLSGNVLTIHGEKKVTSERKGDDYCHCECCYGAFTRSVELPATADFEQIDAEQCNGVLTVCVKKQPTAQAKRIDVRTASPEFVDT